eukprot:gnl/MRDRNA2_/MRDRNA2_74186_c0_seq2.p1 gnl/MRDRNA2_/MRDRNA2_74186_c0~~gnl/MRDRNA2_/MRDRNA2_74186_c0_seq2.p1  ORF type:complete len:143 (+),score=18.90 gnl/MRDRNA2_/MRDRNA2_74186_c0_seq2:96-524(+)
MALSRFQYFGIQEFAQNLKTRGATNYQKAIRDVLAEFERLAERGGLKQRMHAVMLSDGEPTLGCRELHEERLWAQRLRVCLHTVYIGVGQYPPILAKLSQDTGGKRFHAMPCHQSSTVQVVDVSRDPVVIGHQSTIHPWIGW